MDEGDVGCVGPTKAIVGLRPITPYTTSAVTVPASPRTPRSWCGRSAPSPCSRPWPRTPIVEFVFDKECKQVGWLVGGCKGICLLRAPSSLARHHVSLTEITSSIKPYTHTHTQTSSAKARTTVKLSSCESYTSLSFTRDACRAIWAATCWELVTWV